MKKKFMAAIALTALVTAGSFQAIQIWAKEPAQTETVQAETGFGKYQVVPYTDNAGNEIDITVYTNPQEDYFSLQFNYGGVDMDLLAEKTGDGNYHIMNGDFFQTNGQAVIEQAVENGKWN